jgi:hypothetical protein
MRWLRRLWRCQSGAILSSEYLILGTLLALGLIVGFSAARDAIVSELRDYADAISGINNGEVLGPGEFFVGNEQGTSI